MNSAPDPPPGMPPASRDAFERVDRLLDQALDRESVERAALIEEVRRRDPTTGDRLEALLAAADDADQYLARPVYERAGGLIDSLLNTSDGSSSAVELPLEHIGPYRLLREAGRGGMGSVFLAERDDAEFRLLVALKLLPRELGTDQMIRRFLDERRILASLAHPNIARLLDGGVEGGLPYYAMEYVDGTPIDRYCDDCRMSVEARLELFCQVCLAVQYAHRNLVIHRDLKPSNVLVDADGTAKLLDFGIAQLSEEAPAGSGSAAAGARLMTPEYASPEQLRGENVSTASDIYALGVLLHELLVGCRPYNVPSRQPDEILKLIAEQRRGSASDTLHQMDDAGRQAVALARRTNPGKLSRRLHGDLDAIILKATHPEAESRYGTVEQLAADVRNHLEGNPVSARNSTPGYRLAKFARRHAAAVGAAAVLVFLLGGFTVVTLLQSQRVTAERDKARQVSAFLVSLFSSTDPYGGGGAKVAARDVLDSGAVRIQRELAGQPELRGNMMAVMAESYSGLGLYREARELAESSLAIERDLHGDNSVEVSGVLTQLALAVHGQGDYQAAADFYRQALQIRRALFGRDHPFVARTMNALAQSLRLGGDYQEAESLLREALAIDRRHPGDDGEDIAQSLRGLAHVMRDRGNYDDAEPLYREAYEAHRTRLGADHPETANSLVNLGLIISAQGDPATAEPMVRRGLEIKRRTFGDNHSDVATDMASLAGVLHQLGHDNPAESLYRRAITLHRAARLEGHPRTATALLGLGELLMARHEEREAEPLLREALTIRRQSLPPGHWRVAQASAALGACLFTLGDSDEAEPLLRNGYSGLLAVLGPGHRETRKASEWLELYHMGVR